MTHRSTPCGDTVEVKQCVINWAISAKANRQPARYELTSMVNRFDFANQYCLFLKPSVTDPGTDFPAIMELVLNKIENHRLHLDDVIVLPGWFLKRHRIMMRHYAVLNSLAANPIRNLSDTMRTQFRKIFDRDITEVSLLGGFDFLERFHDVSPHALELLWENIPQCRLGSGAFCGKVKVEDGGFYLVNGFVPNLMEMYARAETTIVVLFLTGDLPWAAARNVFVGASDPSKASSGSLRNEFFVRRRDLRLNNLRLGSNGVHLSAGPIEALAELGRFASSVSSRSKTIDFQFGRKLAQKFTAEEVEVILTNPTVHVAEGKKSLFELTEEMDEDTALSLLFSLKDQLSFDR